MDYKLWSQCEAVPLTNGIMTRRTGLNYMKSPEEISAYYREHFGTYWFDELPKTDNVWSPTSKFYGCTLAPGVPLIPNMCRRALHSPGSGEYDYSFRSLVKTQSEETNANHHNSWIEKNNFFNNNGKNYNHYGESKLHKRKLDWNDSGLDSDSDLEDSCSQNTVTWLSWIITTITTVVTVITETVVGRQSEENHVHTRVPLKQTGGVSWYQYPVLWTYKVALLVQQADVWLMHKVKCTLRLESYGTSQQRRKWALIVLLIALLLWAGFKLVEWLLDEDPEGLALSDLSPLPYLWAVWDFTSECLSAAWLWFDGSWLLAPWLAVSQWYQNYTTIVDASEWDWSAITWPFSSVAALAGSAVSALGEGSVTVFASVCSSLAFAFAAVGSFLATMLTWIVDCVACVPTLLSSGFAFILYPIYSFSWKASPVDYSTSEPAQHYRADPASSQAPASLDHLLTDKQMLALLVRNLLNSEEFERAMEARQYTNQEQVNSAVDQAFTDALSKIDQGFKRVKEELKSKVHSEESSVETKMEALKAEIQELQMALMAHKALVSEQAVLGNRLEARMTYSEQLYLKEGEEEERLRQLILLEVAKIKEEINLQLTNVQFNQKVVTDSYDSPMSTNPTELEAMVNSTVQRLLAIYDADKIAKVDYALATSGGSVLNVRCTETFSKKNAQYYMWGYPLWSKASNDPRIALEPAINPGECWAFTGSRGHMVIELSDNITVTAFTMEHLPRSLSPTGTIDTAPKDFKVLGLRSEQDDMPVLLGQFKYEDNGVSLQHFLAREIYSSFKIVELVIESNHGNLEYTCLYRFRVHGRPHFLTPS